MSPQLVWVACCNRGEAEAVPCQKKEGPGEGPRDAKRTKNEISTTAKPPRQNAGTRGSRTRFYSHLL
eukprot:scaffold220812_cov60-Cyclotella_meneghiniana.AAC.1